MEEYEKKFANLWSWYTDVRYIIDKELSSETYLVAFNCIFYKSKEYKKAFELILSEFTQHSKKLLTITLEYLEATEQRNDLLVYYSYLKLRKSGLVKRQEIFETCLNEQKDRLTKKYGLLDKELLDKRIDKLANKLSVQVTEKNINTFFELLTELYLKHNVKIKTL